jgi:DNA-binding NarL/FixJ family response regulator
MTIHRTGRCVINALVLDPQPLWQRTLESMLTRLGVRVVAACSVADELTRSVGLKPQLVVVDPDGAPDFADVLRGLRETLPGLTTIVITSRRDPVWRRELEAAGIGAIIEKRNELDVIESALDAAIEAAFQCSRLTSREIEILELVADGRTNREVASALWLSDQTVKFHLANVYRKLGVGGRREAVDLARNDGLLPLAFESSDRKEGDEDLASAALG